MAKRIIQGVYGIGAALLGWTAPAVAQERSYNLPAGELRLTLPEFARQSGVQIVAPADQVMGLRTPELKGRLDRRVALRRLLANVNLDIVSDNGSVVMLRMRKPVPEQSSFRTRNTFLASAALSALVAAPAAAQDTSGASEAVAPASDLIVTGTRQVGRTALESTAPIDSIGAQQIQAVGNNETSKILATLVPSMNFPQPAITDGTDTVRPVTLRGLSPDETLVLINGKRRHVSALLNVNGSVGRGASAVDMNAIPSTALKRVEVLRDGAAAQYGSDAIAGVVNFLLNDADHGGSVNVTFGEYVTQPTGMRDALGLVTGSNDQPVQDPLLPAGSYQIQRGGKEHRTDGQTITATANFGMKIGPEGFLNVSGEYRKRNKTNRADVDPRREYALINGSVDPREFSIDRNVFLFGNPETEEQTIFYNSGYHVSDTVDFYSYGSFQHREASSFVNFRQPLNAASLPSIYPNGFMPVIFSKNDDLSFAAGFKGELGEWNWDLSGVFGQNKIKYYSQNSLNPSLGVTSPTEFYGGSVRFQQTTFNADVTRDFDVGLAKPLTLALGAEYRKENYKITAGELNSYVDGGRAPAGVAPGAQAAIYFKPDNQVDASRDSVAAYIELDTAITDPWTVQVAGRFEHYSDFGNTWNGKVATRYEVAPWLAARGAISTGFRAPSLSQQFYTSTTTNFIGGIPFEVGTYPVGTQVAQLLGATPLKPEKSMNYSAGLVLTPVPRMAITIDAYQIDIDDRILLTENLTALSSGVSVQSILQANGIQGVNSARFFINGVDTRTRGIDVTATYRPNLPIPGALNFTAGFNYNTNKVLRRVVQVGALSLTNPSVLFSRQNTLRLEQGNPRDRISFSANYDLNKVGFQVRLNRYGKVLAAGDVALNDVMLEPRILTDLEASYRFSKGFAITVGAENVFDVYPTKSPIGQRADGSLYAVGNSYFPYSSFSPFGFNGRYVYARAGLKF